MANQDVQSPGNQNKNAFSGIDDNEVLKRVLEGEKNLFALLIRKYNQRLYRIGISIVNDETEVEDIMQMTYIKAYENLNKFKFQSGFSTWLTKIMVNESLLYVKKRKQTTSRAKKKFLQDTDLHPVERQTPLMKVLNAELKTILETAIRELPEKHRTVFIMRELENMSVAETMECLDLSEANVKIRLNRAKVMLRDKLREYLKDKDILQLYQSHCDKMVDSVMEKIIKRDKTEQ